MRRSCSCPFLWSRRSPSPQYVCCLRGVRAIRVLLFQSHRRATDPNPSAVCACVTCACFFSVLTCVTSMLIPCNSRNTETSVFGQRTHQFLHSLPLVHKQFCGGCVPGRSSGLVAKCVFPACSVISAPGHYRTVVRCRTCIHCPLDCFPHRRHRQGPPQRGGPMLSTSSSLSRLPLILYWKIVHNTLPTKMFELIDRFVCPRPIQRSVRYTAVHVGYHASTSHLQRHGLRHVEMRITQPTIPFFMGPWGALPTLLNRYPNGSNSETRSASHVWPFAPSLTDSWMSLLYWLVHHNDSSSSPRPTPRSPNRLVHHRLQLVPNPQLTASSCRLT